ncbi:MAG: hypothetical protein A3B30_04310 [Candidatus Komeilibacteria bacterium RIFCSPLOWO2_01_FULL_52_15]|uniref:Uncharacterized protein n=2 Tax=Candidatus Komeiliibacteriota TaxID=1817908 RepID=A0A1G2BQJ5_9BACT|nr:MAG: hypothetical protein A2677_04070 [Candidatus Komeilibacteria bacterium RIFCSPHIGHO2_01_FULL_52_14]OGY91106.1 MAG: hypothetical protein A3B30_04310 [Candidatus Komeilibacteria bacterium RIFCSPLOWO2_01_FULL_52_15]
MKINRTAKYAVIIVVVIGAIGLGRSIMQPKQQPGGNRIVREQLIADIRAFEIKRTDLTQDEQEKKRKEFDDALKAFDEGFLFVKQQGEGGLAAIYWPLVSLGSIHRDVGDYEKAEETFKYLAEIDPNAFLPYGLLGDLYSQLKQYDKALENYGKAVAISDVDEAFLDTYYGNMYGIYISEKKDPAAAEQMLIDGIKLHPADTNLVAQLALHYRMSGDIDKAISRYKELLAKKPDSIVAKQALDQLEPDIVH